MKKLKNYTILAKSIRKHNKVWKALQIITGIFLLPFVILQWINSLLEITLRKVASLRSKTVDTIFKILYLKECKYNENEDKK